MKRARDELQGVHAGLQDVERGLYPFVSWGTYIPESTRRLLTAKVAEASQRTLPPIAKVAGRMRDPATMRSLEGVFIHAQDLQQRLGSHNNQYVGRMIAAHSKLLIDELGTDKAQQEAIVRDDIRNLVIAGAGSGKTRTIVARIRYLVECSVPASAILAVTFTNKATEEMQSRLKQVKVPLANRGNEGITVSTLHALGKRVVQAALSVPISVADDVWTDSLVAAALRDARTARDPRLAQLYFNAVVHFHRNEDDRAPSVGGDLTYRTLRGEHVRSLGERIIADFLFVPTSLTSMKRVLRGLELAQDATPTTQTFGSMG